MKKLLLLITLGSFISVSSFSEQDIDEIKRLQQEINKINSKLERMEEKDNAVESIDIGGEFEINQTWNNTDTTKGAEDLDFTGELYFTGNPSENVKVFTQMDIEEGSDAEVSKLELTAKNKYGKLNIFQDDDKNPASFQDPLGLFVGERVQPTEGIIFTGKYPNKVYNGTVDYNSMFYNTDSGEFYGLQARYKLNGLGLRLNYVEKISDYFYDEGDESSEDNFNKNSGFDIAYDTKLAGVKLNTELELAQSEGRETPTDDFMDSSTIYGKVKANVTSMNLITEFGYYNSGKDYYSVAGDSSAQVFSHTDKLTFTSDTLAYLVYAKKKIKIATPVELSAYYLNQNTQNEDDKALEYINADSKIKLNKQVELGLGLEYEKEEWIVSDNTSIDTNGTYTQTDQEEPSYVIKPYVTYKPFTGLKLYAESETTIDQEVQMGEDKDKDELTNITTLSVEYSKGKLSVSNETEMDLGPISDYDGDKDTATTNETKFAYYLSDSSTVKVYNNLEISDENKESGSDIIEDVSGDGYANHLVVAYTKNFNKAETGVMAGYMHQDEYAEDDDSSTAKTDSMNFGAYYKYNYDSSTELKLTVISGRTMSSDDEDESFTEQGSYGDDFIDISDDSVEEGSLVTLSLTTKF